MVCEEAAAAAAMAALRSNTLPFTPAGGWGGPVPALASSRVARVEQSTWSVFAVCEKESEVRSEKDSEETYVLQVDLPFPGGCLLKMTALQSHLSRQYGSNRAH